MVDALDLKSSSFTGVSVRVRTRGTNRRLSADTRIYSRGGVARRRICPCTWTRGPSKHQRRDEPADEARMLAERQRQARPAARLDRPDSRRSALILALPFALRAGAEFFMPVTAALVIAIALVPMLEWFERRGVPSRLAAGLCIILFLAVGRVRGRLDRPSGDRLGCADSDEDPEGAGGARAGASSSTSISTASSTASSRRSRSAQRADAHGRASKRRTRCRAC